VTWDDLRAFAVGELGWSIKRFRYSTIVELNLAAGGYWRNWERFAGVPMREICYVNIAGNPNIKNSAKPRSSQDYMKFSIDAEKKENKKPTDEEIEIARKEAFYGRAKTTS
jgi:hypothetical protein